MSIPGLGQIPAQTSASTTRTHKLAPLSEWRFSVSQPAIKVRLLSGTAECDGTELAASQPYRFAGLQSKIWTWHGCELEVDGVCDRDEVVPHGVRARGRGRGYEGSQPPPPPPPMPMVAFLNLHMYLASLRAAAASMPRGNPAATGPRLLVCGPPHAGRTSLVRTLTAWATKMGSAGVAPSSSSSSLSSMSSSASASLAQQPCVVNVDPREGMLSLPGTLSAAVFATLMDLETEGGNGWGGAPSSGPSAVPVKLPLVYHFGYARPNDAPDLYRALVTRLAGAVSARMSEDAAVEASGLLIDTPAVGDGADGADSSPMSIDLLAHVIEEFSVNLVVVLGGEGGDGGDGRGGALYEALAARFANETTTLGEPVTVVGLRASDGVVVRSDSLDQQMREACIREYFFGDAKRTLSPYTQQVDADALTVYRLPPADHATTDAEEANAKPNGDPAAAAAAAAAAASASGPLGGHGLVKVEASAALAHWTLAVMNAGLHDPPDVVQQAAVLGFVYVAEVDSERRKVRILAPVSGRLGDRPLVFGRWPEPYINLVG